VVEKRMLRKIFGSMKDETTMDLWDCCMRDYTDCILLQILFQWSN